MVADPKQKPVPHGDLPWITCRVFVSSTFRDFGAERDALVKSVMPRLRGHLERHRIELVDVDLRWGITREAVAAGDAPRLCLEAVESCRPFFLGFLGETYGNPAGTIDAQSRSKHPWLDACEARSLTDIEMSLALAHPEQAVFCLRDPRVLDSIPEPARPRFQADDPEHRRRLTDLKRRVRASDAVILDGYASRWVDDAIDPFTRAAGAIGGLERLTAELVDHLRDAILRLHGRRDPAGGQDRFARFDASHQRLVDLLARDFAGRSKELAELEAYLEDADRRPALVIGEPGIGKSCVAAALASRVTSRHPDVRLFVHLFGAGSESLSLRNALERLRRHLARAGREESAPPARPNTQETTAERLRSTLVSIPAGMRHVMIFDGIDELDGFAGSTESMAWIPETLPPHVKLVVTRRAAEPDSDTGTTRDGSQITITVDARSPDLERRRRSGDLPSSTVREISLELISDEDAAAQIRSSLSLAARSLSDADIARCVRLNEARSPLALRILLETLRGCTSIDDLESTQRRFPRILDRAPRETELSKAFVPILDRLAEDAGSQKPRDVVRFLCATRAGLLERELNQLIGAPADDPTVPLVLGRLRPFLLVTDGRYRSRYRYAGMGCMWSSERPGHWISADDAHAKLARLFASFPTGERKALDYYFHVGLSRAHRDDLLNVLYADLELLGIAWELDRDAVREVVRAALSWAQGASSDRMLAENQRVARRVAEALGASKWAQGAKRGPFGPLI